MNENNTNENTPETFETNSEIKQTELVEVNSKDNIPKKSKKYLIIGLILLVIIITGIAIFLIYNNSNKKETKEVKEINTEAEDILSPYRMSGNNLDEFDLSFLKIGEKDKNIIYSPLSIKYTLAMLSDGSDGNSKKQIDALIGDYKSNKYTNSSNMSLANALFIQNSFKDTIKASYIDTLNNKYSAEVLYDSFETPTLINKWVNNKTFGLINNLVDDVKDKQFVLVNALAIDMEWNKFIQATNETFANYYSIKYEHENYSEYINVLMEDNYGTVKFNNGTIDAKAVEIGASINNYDIVSTLGEDNIRNTITKEYTQWLEENTCGDADQRPDATTYVNKYIEELNSNYKKVAASTDFKFYDNEFVKVFAKEMKEYNNTTLEYIGIMPKKVTLNEYIKTTSAKDLNQIINKTKTIELDNFEKGKVYKITGGIPLFKYDYKLNLMDDLKNLGVKDVFTSGKANLSRIVNNSNAFIGGASHKANIEFSNEGIKAAAVTQGGGLGDASCGFEHLYDVPVVEINLTFNNPYLYIIRDKNSGEVWFAGTVYEPTVNTNVNRVIE